MRLLTERIVLNSCLKHGKSIFENFVTCAGIKDFCTGIASLLTNENRESVACILLSNSTKYTVCFQSGKNDL